jgi:hypothetical protein
VFVTVLASAATPVSTAADLLTCLGAGAVRRLGPREVLLAFVLGGRSRAVFMDRALLGHDELLVYFQPLSQQRSGAPQRCVTNSTPS